MEREQTNPNMFVYGNITYCLLLQIKPQWVSFGTVHLYGRKIIGKLIKEKEN